MRQLRSVGFDVGAKMTTRDSVKVCVDQSRMFRFQRRCRDSSSAVVAVVAVFAVKDCVIVVHHEQRS